MNADQRFEEETVGQFGGFGPKSTHLQDLLEDVTQLLLTFSGIHLSA